MLDGLEEITFCLYCKERGWCKVSEAQEAAQRPYPTYEMVGKAVKVVHERILFVDIY